VSRTRRLAIALSSAHALLAIAALTTGGVIWLALAEAPRPELELGVVMGPTPWRFTTAMLGLSAARGDGWLLLAGGALTFYGLIVGQRSIIARRPAVAVASFAFALAALSFLGNARLGVVAAMLVNEEEGRAELTGREASGALLRTTAPFPLQLRDLRLPAGSAARTAEASCTLCRTISPAAPVCQEIGAGRALRRQGWTFHLAGYQLRPDAQRYLVELGPRAGVLDYHWLERGEALKLPTGGRLRVLHHAKDVGGMGEALRVRWTAPGAAAQSLLLFRQFPEVDSNLRRGAHELRYLGVERRFDAVLAVRRAPFTPVLVSAFVLLGFALLAALRPVSWWTR